MKILIVTKNWLGDILFEIPAIEMIRRQYPDAEILCLTHPRCRQMLEHHPAIHRIIEFDERSTHRSLLSRIQFIQAMRKEKIDVVYFFHRSRTRASLLKLAGIPKLVGYGVKWPHFLTHPVPEPAQPLHHVDYFVELLAQDGFSKPENPSYRFYHAAKDRLSIERYLEQEGLAAPFVCFHLGANWEPKRWPAAHFAQLASLIYRKWKLPVILTGGPGDKALGEQVIAEAKEAKVTSFIGKTTLGELGALFSRAQFVVSGDSGPMHIASGVGARVLALFGPTNPDLTGPRGKGETHILKYVPKGYTAPWFGKQLPAGGWLSNITPIQVLFALEEKGWASPMSSPQASGGDLRFGSPTKSFGDDDSKNILLITLSNIGDVILTTPVLMSLAARFPQHKITVVAGPRTKGILAGSRFIDRLVIYDKHASLGEKIQFLRELRRDRYDVVVDLKNSAVPFLVSSKRRSPLFRTFQKKKLRDRHLEVLESMGLSVHPIPSFDFYNEEEEASAFTKLQRKGIPLNQEWIAISPIAASEHKTWPITHYRELIQKLVQETPYSIFLLGGERESRMMDSLIAVAPERVFNTAGLVTLRESAALLAKSRLIITNDSSAAHFGFEMNHPMVVIFGPTDPETVARQGKCFRVVRENIDCKSCAQNANDHKNHECLKELSPTKVMRACLELLPASSPNVLVDEK